MDRKIPLIILAISLLVLAVAILLPGGRTVDGAPKLPWRIDIQADGATRVFDLTLGQSPLRQASELLGAEPKLSLFRSVDGSYAIEAYFQRVALSGLRADFIFSLDIEADQAASMFERGLRISQLGSGTKKVELNPTDSATALASPIRHLTYIPMANLDAELIERQFGQPAQILDDPEGAQHWLYPDKGLDIALNPDAKEVFQYVHPADFEQLLAPLKQPGSAQPTLSH